MLFDNKYEILSLLGSGAFCNVILGRNINSEEEVAIKIEEKSSNMKTLQHEAKIYLYLNKIPNIPKIKTYGSNEKYNFLILQRLGLSLFDITKIMGKIPIQDILLIAKETLLIIKSIHEKGIIHRDIKPENFLFDNKSSELYIIDFGLARQYIRNGNHIDFKTNKTLLGTPSFASINNHKGQEQSRRDDIESWIYSMIFCAKGYLPWEDVNKKIEMTNIEYNNKMLEIKINLDLNELIYEIKDWKSLKELIMYIRNLRFEEKPNYEKILTLLN